MDSELHVALRIRSLLDRSASTLSSGPADRLHAARRLALSRARTEDARPRSGREVLLLELSRIGLHPAALLGLTLIVVTTMAISSWNGYVQGEECAAVDTELLADDLPIDVYADAGFVEWLEQSSPAGKRRSPVSTSAPS